MLSKYPEVVVQLSGENGNVYAIISRCTVAARRAKIDREEINAFMTEAMSGDYDNALMVCMKWFTCN